ncbi:hypothetical protein QWI17_16270 [Gilvimarinus sp. SDUM040013]|uniref:Uncharacterized protein n=1 Tax=Gilvimarinus gilvus TaxID=3058038 RepID=A0ABU4RYL5_9GAMM|nr:hypothetical protein [Gilvimarinus sp. SDUM040013]MDO3387398.1 hypothetical protein [Gilvimarinus sp. SDUM040013]MDX6849875.1 hypothetical protein [Gilvimarinus sp. SDUM040013]
MQTSQSIIPLRPLRYISLLAAILLAQLLIISYYVSGPDEIAQAAAQEGNLIDWSSALGYFIGVATMLIFGGYHVIRYHWPLMLSLALLGMRELDLDKKFSTYGLFKSATLKASDVSLLEKGITIVIIAAIASLTILLIKRYWRTLISSFFHLEAVSFITCFAGGMLVLARTLDGISRKAADFGVVVTQHNEILTTIAEEVLELGAPYTFILAFFAYRRIYLAAR